MKKKIFNILFALVLALSFSLITAAPMSTPALAASATNPPTSNTGSWNNATSAYADGGNYAYITSGTPSASHTYSNYGFSLTGQTITQVRVRYDAWSNGASVSTSQVAHPTGDGDVDGTWTLTSGTQRWALVDEEPFSDSDYITCTSNGGGYSLYTYSAFSVPAGSTITSVVLDYRDRRTDSGTADVEAYLKVGGSYYAGGAHNPSSSTSFTARSFTWPTNPKTGSEWTVNDVNGVGTNALQQFGNYSNDSDPDIRISYCKLTVNYNYTEYNDQIRVDVSWDNGFHWSSKQTQTLTSSETTYWYDVTGATSWTPTKLNNTNFKVRVDAYTQGTAEVVRLDWLPVEVTYCTAPTAAFSADTTSGCGPLTVNFTDSSTNSPTSWAWDFDNNGTTDSTAQNPTHQYSAGTYTVKLTATNACGSDDEIKTGYITVTSPTTWYRDSDGDGYGNSAVSTQACTAPPGYVANSTDCNDGNAAVHPGATEVCGDAIDNDCDGYTDCADSDCSVVDADADGYYAEGPCCGTDCDCDDTDPNIHPGALEVCDNIDNDCDGLVDGADPDFIHPQVQLAMILDGSSSIDGTEWSTMINGLAAAVENFTCMPHDGTVELTVVQFGGNPGQARLEIGPVVITSANAADVAYDIRHIVQLTGYTPMACGIYLAADKLHDSPCFNISLKQAINLVTDGEPNSCCPSGSNYYNASLCCPGTSGCNDAKNSAIDALTYAISHLGMTADQDEFDVEGIGISTGNLDWLKNNIIFPATGYSIPPENWPPPGPGWVRAVGNFTDFANTICEKFAVVICTPPTVSAGADQSICNGGSVQIGGSPTGSGGTGTLTYSWSPTDGLDNSSLANPTASPDTTTNYMVTVTDANQCYATDNVTVIVNAKPAATASSNSPVCIGATIQLTGGPDNMTTYSWTGPNGFTSALQSPPITNATAAMSGTYTLTVTEGICSDNATVAVSVIQCGGGGGGGGGGGVSAGGTISSATATCPLTLTVNMLGAMTTAKMTFKGVLCEDCLASDPTGQNIWEATEGTQLLCANNRVPELIELTLGSSPPPPSNAAIVGPIYELNAYTSKYNPSPLTISPDATLALAYNPSNKPQNTSALTIAYYDEDAGQWVPMETAGYVAGGVEVPNVLTTHVTHLTYFAVLAELKGATPAKFEASNLTINPSQAELNQEVNISVNVANTGGTTGSYSLELDVNGILQSAKQVTVAAGTSQTVNFTVTGDTVGTHQVEVAGLSGEFAVAGPPSVINWWLIGGITGAILLIIIGIVVWRRQRRGY